MAQTTSSESSVAEDRIERAPENPDRPLWWVFGGAIAVLTWFGWAAIAPSLGFPILAPAVMLNRALHVDLGSRWGWAALVLGLGLLSAAYAVAVSAGLIPRGLRSALLLATGAWLVVGAVVMPLLALATPDAIQAQLRSGAAIAGMTVPTNPEAMTPTFMMLRPGILAPVEALIGWLLFGGVLGAVGMLIEPSVAVVEDVRGRGRRGLAIVGSAALIALAVGSVWVIGHPVEAQALSCGPEAGKRIVDTVVGDVEVTAHGTICVIRGTVEGTVTVRDVSDACTKRNVLTGINVVGGTIEGDVHAEGRRCVMVWLRDGASVSGNILYEARGNLGFLGKGEGASVRGNVVSTGGQLWATGTSRTNRVDGDLICNGAEPAGGPGSATNWDGLDKDTDGVVGGTFRC